MAVGPKFHRRRALKKGNRAKHSARQVVLGFKRKPSEHRHAPESDGVDAP
jgi:hypothetical protein